MLENLTVDEKYCLVHQWGHHHRYFSAKYINFPILRFTLFDFDDMRLSNFIRLGQWKKYEGIYLCLKSLYIGQTSKK